MAFFEKDTIDWKRFELESFYSELLTLKRENQALWNGPYGAMPLQLQTGNPNVVAFSREKESNCVEVIINLSEQVQEYQINNIVKKGKLSPFEYVITVK